MARNCKIHKPTVIGHAERFGQPLNPKPIYSLDELLRAQKDATPVCLEGHVGIILSIEREDGSNRNWMIRLAKPTVCGFWFIKWTAYVPEDKARFFKAC